MLSLLIRTLSQALQAFLPAAVALAWLQRHGDHSGAKAVRLGLIGAVLLSPIAGSLFQQVSRQAQLEATLAWITAGIAFAALWAMRRTSPGRTRSGGVASLSWPLAAAVALVVLRQTMEIAVVLRVAAFDLRSLEATLATASGLLLGIGAACAWWWAGRAATAGAAGLAARVFCLLFMAQAMLYAFHESAESGWLPWSSFLHAATEPYGPDGMYGPLGSGLVAVVPVLVALMARTGTTARPGAVLRRMVRPALVVAIVGLAGFALLRPVAVTDPLPAADPGLPGTAGALASAEPGGILFRRTNIEQGYGLLSGVALDSPGAAAASASLACERVAFAGGRGICLQARRALFTTYRAVLLDTALAPGRTLNLGGSPSRTRISADGRVGAVTVFDTNVHTYSAATFSTITTLIDMTTGDAIGNLESFATWRDGKRLTAADFNFWGVTFARDSNTFYATLRTAGTAYLVRGDLGLRKLTVLRENVECPSLSPNNRLMAFKKRVGAGSAPWRLYILDVATLAEHALAAESRSIDDQIEWLDDERVLYGVPRAAPSAVTDVWVAPVDGSAQARVFVAEAESPAVVR